MSSETTGAKRRWYVIYTHPKQEERADRNLRAWGVETFSPRTKVRRYNQFRSTPSYVIKYLFPRYFFARFAVVLLINKVRFTRGVKSVITFGDEPTPVDDRLIALMQMQVGADGLIQINNKINPGDEVLIKEGPMRNLIGVFEREMKDAERVMLLLKAVSYQARVLVSKELIEKVG